MVFSSYIFLFAFLPITLIGYFLLSKVNNGIYQRIFLIIASLFFYGYYNIKYLFLITGSIVVNYLIALMIQKGNEKKAKAYLVTGILFNVSLIGYFKYYDFFIENINAIFNSNIALKNILLPLGISFFTFQQLSFLVSVYKKEEKVEKLRDYCLFVTFFPQLVAGPIVLYSEMLPQFKDDKRRALDLDNLCKGIFILSIGLFKKAVIADTLDLFVTNGYKMTDLSLVCGWATSLSYTLQIYFDFSGYTDMAIGLGKMFNIDIPVNFLSPYKSKSITEFWRRWHITLGRALSTYVYVPLGGNRKGIVRTCINLFITFVISGIWHGAAWTFIIWGTAHGIIVIIERILDKYIKKIPDILRQGITFLIVNALWVLFRAENIDQAIEVYKGMVNIRNIGIYGLADIAFDRLINFPAIVDIVYVLTIITVLLFVTFKKKNSVEMYNDFIPGYRNVIISAVLFFISILCLTRESVLILGSSMTQNFDMDYIRKTLGGNPLRIGVSQMNVKEMKDLAKIALNAGKADTIYLCIDLPTFAKEEENDLPDYAIENNFLSKIRYSLSFENWFRFMPVDIGLSLAKKLLGNLPKNYQYSMSIDHLEDWSMDVSFGKDVVLEKYENKRYAVSDINQENLLERIKQNIDELCENIDWDKAEFIVFLPPYSSLYWCDVKEKGYYDDFIEAKKYLVKRFNELGCTTYDFQSDERTLDLEDYKDYTHYSPKTNNWMIDCFKNNDYLVDIDNYDEMLEKQYNNTIEFRKDYEYLFE